MTTPNDTTPTDDTTNQTTTDRTPSERGDTDPSPRTIPGRTPITEAAGAPIVPTTRPTTERSTAIDTARRLSPPPTDGERDAPLVPDLRPAGRSRTDGGSR